MSEEESNRRERRKKKPRFIRLTITLTREGGTGEVLTEPFRTEDADEIRLAVDVIDPLHRQSVAVSVEESAEKKHWSCAARADVPSGSSTLDLLPLRGPWMRLRVRAGC